jgi:hypothetical protein
MKTYSKIPKICSSNPKFFRSIPLNPSSILWHYPFKMISFTEMKVFSKKAFPISRKNNRGCDWLLYFPLTKKKGRGVKNEITCLYSFRNLALVFYFYRFKFEQQLDTVTINLSWDQLPHVRIQYVPATKFWLRRSFTRTPACGREGIISPIPR